MKKDTAIWADILELHLWDRNYRKGDVAKVKASISRFGFNGVLRVRGGVVYAGNHSLKALRELRKGGDAAPVGIKVIGDVWYAPIVTLDHLNETESAAFAIADNRTHDVGRDDAAALEAILRDISVEDETLGLAAGFSEEFLAKLSESNDDEVGQRIATNPESAQPSNYLKWGKNEVLLSSEEFGALSASYRAYVEQFGTGIGFVRDMLGLS